MDFRIFGLSKHPSIRLPEHPNIRTSEHPNIRASDCPNIRTSDRPNIRLSEEIPNSLLVRILLHLVVEKLNLYAGLAEEFLALSTGMVFALADHTFDAAVDYEHGAGAAWGHAAVERGAVEGYATAGGLADGVLLGMHGTDAMGRDMAVGIDGLAEQVSHLVAVWQACR